MGEVGLQRWQLPFLKQLAAEIFQTGALRAAADSYCNHWLTHVASADDREELEALIPDGDDTEEEEEGMQQQHAQQEHEDQDMMMDPGEDEAETNALVDAFEQDRQRDAPSQAPMTQAASPDGDRDESSQQEEQEQEQEQAGTAAAAASAAGGGTAAAAAAAAAAASASSSDQAAAAAEEAVGGAASSSTELSRQDTLPLADETSQAASASAADTAAAAPAQRDNTLAGSSIYIDPDSYTEDEVEVR